MEGHTCDWLEMSECLDWVFLTLKASPSATGAGRMSAHSCAVCCLACPRRHSQHTGAALRMWHPSFAVGRANAASRQQWSQGHGWRPIRRTVSGRPVTLRGDRCGLLDLLRMPPQPRAGTATLSGPSLGAHLSEFLASSRTTPATFRSSAAPQAKAQAS